MVRMTVNSEKESKESNDESKPRVTETLRQSEGKGEGDGDGWLIVEANEDSIQCSDQNTSLLKRSATTDTHDCPICLTSVCGRAYADPCLHEFCRHCIEKWSETSNKCPLCRRIYISIIHNVRSATQYERIPVVGQSSAGGLGVLLTNEGTGLLFTPLDSGIYMVNPRPTPHGIQQNILFLAPNQNFFLANLNPSTSFVRPESFSHILNQS